MPRITLSWKPIEADCDRIAITLKLEWKGLSAVTTIEEDRNWPARDIVFDDVLYPLLVAVFPDLYEAADYTITIRVCPEGYTPFPVEERVITLQAVLQENGEDWSGDWSIGGANGLIDSSWVVGQGSCLCGAICNQQWWVTAGRGAFTWNYDPYKNKILVAVGIPWEDAPDYLEVAGGSVYIEYEDCGWAETEFVVPLTSPAKPDSTWTARITQAEACYVNVPVDPPDYCNRKSLCVLLSVDDRENYQYYTLVWNNDTQQYELGPVSVPGGKPYTIEITLVEDAGSLPPGSPVGSRAWVLTVTIREVPSGDVVLEYTEVYVIDCRQTWTRTSPLTVPIAPEETWELTIGTSCPDAPEPPECDPGCWPECVMCPTRKTLYAVVSDAPDCCLSGTYALTWVNTGGGGAPTVGYYELPAPVGGPTGTCGQITFLRVSCVDASHITVQLVYLRAEGTEISNLSSPATLSVVCDGSGHLESDVIHVPGRSADRESLCGFGSGVGGDIRIVSA